MKPTVEELEKVLDSEPQSQRTPPLRLRQAQLIVLAQIRDLLEQLVTTRKE